VRSSRAIHMIPEGVCIPEAEGLLSNQSSGCNIEFDGRRTKDQVRCDWTRSSGGCGVLGEMMGCTRHVILEGVHIPRPWGCILTRVLAVTLECDWERPLRPGQVVIRTDQ